ncbi:hypothetical protein [Vagococcus allomyrinae]|nr:hypothetical protein [Vagococcus allomyrinae]
MLYNEEKKSLGNTSPYGLNYSPKKGVSLKEGDVIYFVGEIFYMRGLAVQDFRELKLGFEDQSAIIYEGQSKQLKVTNERNEEVPLAKVNLTYDKNMIKIDDKGMVTGIKLGKGVI